MALLLLGSCGDDGGGPGTVTDVPDVPDGTQADGWNPPPQTCTNNGQCGGLDGLDTCRIARCDLSLGTCGVFQLPNCCTNDVDCDDGDPVTNDSCDTATNICEHEDTSKPCTTDADCATNESCITFECDGFCVYWHKAECCAGVDDCADGDDCTLEACENFECRYDPSDAPQCCGEQILTEAFTGGLGDGWDVDGNGEAVMWHHSEVRSNSAGGSAAFQDPDSGTYQNPTEDTEVPASMGTLTSPSVDIPADTETTLSFWVYTDLEKVDEYDLFYLQVLSDMDSIPTIWQKGDLAEEQWAAWTQVVVDVSAHAGETVRFQWVVDTIDGTVNDAQGVFLDDVAVTTGCVQETICETDADCDDGDPCTENACGDEGVCGTSPVLGCCSDESECGPGNDCSKLVGCVDGQCLYDSAPGCCTTAADCDNGDPCTAGTCTDNGECVQELVPNCCQPEIGYGAAFELGDDGGIEITNDQVGGWNISEVNAWSEPASLHYGDPTTGTYDFDGASSGVARLPVLSLPADQPATLDFMGFFDIETFANADRLEIFLRVEGGEPTLIWSKDQLAEDQYKAWVPVSIDLSGYAGTTMRVQLRFDTIDPIQNDGQGVFVDDISISWGCGDVNPCDFCDDGDPCTLDECTDDGQCFYVPNPDPECGGDCDSPADCNDGDLCTADFCLEGQCQNIAVPGCGEGCQTNLECVDDNPCTEDFCGDDGLCLNLAIPGCGEGCDGAEECEDDDDCTADFCIDGQCQNLGIPGCGGGCKTDEDCDDNDICTIDQCLDGGDCEYIPFPLPLPECEEPVCDGPEDCDDGNDCTADFCQDEQCLYLAIPGCGPDCQGPGDCEDANDCTADFCLDGECQNLEIPGCLDECVSDADCADDDPCTADSCDGGQCASTIDPDCASCQSGSAFFESFDSALGNVGWALSPANSGVGWHIGAFPQAQSAPGALYYGNPEAMNYDSAGPNSGTATSPKILLGTDATGISLTFSIAADLEQVQAYDQLELVLETGTGEELPIWTKIDLGGQFGTDYVSQTVDLTPFSGQVVQLRWEFDTVDGILNDTVGVFIDDISILQICDEPECTPDQPGICDDGDACTVDLCSPTGICTHAPIAGCCISDAQCGDDNVCTQNACNGNVCVSTPIPGCCADSGDCADDDDCTTEVCISNGCLFIPIPGCGGECDSDADCEDGSKCTDDFCSNGQCVSASVPGCCESDEVCDDGDDCTKDGCIFNTCFNQPIEGCGAECASDSECADNDACTLDQCSNGICFHTPVAPCCTTNAQCNDGDPCTTDSCGGDNLCDNTPIPNCPAECETSADCADGDVCTADSCLFGTCQNTPVPSCCTSSSQCSDGDPCTADLCSGNQCASAPIPGCCTSDAQCDDGDACTVNACGNANQCLSTPVPGCCKTDAECSDGNPCTKDSCTSNLCTSEPSSDVPGCCVIVADCEDGDACTNHACNAGICATTPKPDCCASDADCDDGVTCTQNSCVANSCQTSPIPGCCSSDGDCDDGVICTSDVCDTASGECGFAALPGCCTLDSQCDDGQVCTTDECVANQCQHTDDLGCCTSDADCSDSAGACQKASCIGSQCFVENIPGCCVSDAQCEDGDPCTTNTCVASNCQSSDIAGCCTSAGQCDDGNDCTVDACTSNQCSNTGDPDCCAPVVISAEDFNGGALPGWVLGSGGDATWQLGGLQALSPPGALWYGNAETGTFESAQGASAGTASTPFIVLPAGEDLLLTFHIWLDIESGGSYDLLELRVVPLTGGNGPLVWDKSAVDANDYQSWVATQVNLTAFAGQVVRLSFAFDTVDEIQNETQGIFVDDLSIETSCESLEDLCVFDGECDDGLPCTNDSCTGGGCNHNPIPDCCVGDGQCDDNYACTTDTCVDGTCEFVAKPSCCVFDGECDDGNPCTTDKCAGNTCSSTSVSGDTCCLTDGDCDDGDPCTKGTCSANQCQFVADTGPGCCEEESLFGADFDDATTQGMTVIQDGSEAKWSVQTKRHFSPPFSLYFGIPGAWNYDTSPPASGVAFSPDIDVPLTAAGATLSFQTWFDTLNFGFGDFGDVYNVKVLSESVLKTVWTKPSNSEQQWIEAVVDLGGYKGKTIQIQFNFQAVDAPFGTPGEGVFLDNVHVSTSCN